MKKMSRICCALALLLMSLGTVTSADAALAARSETTNSATGGHPFWFRDAGGLTLQPCLDVLTLGADGLTAPCGLEAELGFFIPVPGQPATFPGNFPTVFPFFQVAADGLAGAATTEVVFSLAGGFVNEVPIAGAGTVSQSLFIRIRPAVVGGTYRLQHPWGEVTFVCLEDDCSPTFGIAEGQVQQFSQPAEGVIDFDAARDGNLIGSFLQSVNATLGFEDFLGDGATPGPVTGGTERNNIIVTDPNGNVFTTSNFVVVGKKIGIIVEPGNIFNFGAANITAPLTSTAPQTVTVTNITANDITFPALAAVIPGTNTIAADFVITAPAEGEFCSGNTINAEGACSFIVTFAPADTTPASAFRAATILLNPTADQLPNPPPVILSLSGTAQFPLTVTVTGTGPEGNLGSGSVRSSLPTAGINNCTSTGGTCTASFDAGSIVTLIPTASTNPLSLFNGWSGACESAAGNCIVTMDAEKAATADFIKAWNVTTSLTPFAAGTITPNQTVKDAGAPTLIITLNNAKSRINTLTDNGVSVIDALVPLTDTTFSYTLNNVTANHAIVATVIPVFTLTATAGADGSISPPGPIDIDQGGNQTFTITPDVNFQILKVTDNGVEVTTQVVPDSVTPGQFNYVLTNILASHAVIVNFVKKTFTVTADTVGGGTIIPSSSVVSSGDNQIFTFTPPGVGFHIGALSDSGNPAASAASAVADLNGAFTYTATNVSAARTVRVTFVINSYTLAATAEATGLISGPTAATHGTTTASFVITPKAKFQVKEITLNGVPQTFTKSAALGGAVTFNLPAVIADQTVSATFMPSGDLDGNGELAIGDALKALRIAVGLDNAVGEDQLAMDVSPTTGGVNGKPVGDKKLDINDVVVILRRSVGLVNW